MKIGVIGTGYVGLVVGVGLADAGHEVICSDSNSSKIETLKKGHIPFYEPGLEDLLHINQKRLTFTSSVEEVVQSASVLFLSIGTPENEDGSANLENFYKCLEVIFRTANEEKTLILKSTVPVGTADHVASMGKELCPFPVKVVSNPEFLRQGSALEDFLKPDRVVLGISDESSRGLMSQIYEPITRSTQAPVLFMDHRSAELVKYAANSFLALKISYINELAHLAEHMGANIDLVKDGFTSDQRINPAFFSPGIGFGGSCFPKDLRALIHDGERLGVETSILKSALRVNESQRDLFVSRVKSKLGDLKGMRIGVLGLAFKPKTDDVRRAPSIQIIENLVNEGAYVQAFDPIAMENAKKAISVEFKNCEIAIDVAKDADALLVLTEWPEFRALDLNEIKSLMKRPLIFDGRNLFASHKMATLGFEYYGIGKGPHSKS